MNGGTQTSMDEIRAGMRTAGEALFKKCGSCGNFDDWNAAGTNEFKYPHEVEINGTLYSWRVSESHRTGRCLCTAREMWVWGGRIPQRTKFSVGTQLTKTHLNKIIQIISKDQDL